jgi:large subunit ribosomal protein L28
MGAKCAISGKRALVGNLVSHANNKTKTRQKANLHRKRIYVEELKKYIKVRISCHALRTIDKIGLLPYLKKKNLTLRDIT